MTLSIILSSNTMFLSTISFVANAYPQCFGSETLLCAFSQVLRAGTDVDCGGFVSKYAPSALAKGLITEADIITRLSVLFKIRMRLGHFDPEGPLQRIPKSVVCTDYSKGLANAGAAQGASLLKNVQATLPLDAAKAGTVAVIGPNANLSKTVAGYYGPGQVTRGAV